MSKPIFTSCVFASDAAVLGVDYLPPHLEQYSGGLVLIISVMPLLAADSRAADGLVRGGMEGSERQVTVVFIDLRGSTKLGEMRSSTGFSAR